MKSLLRVLKQEILITYRSAFVWVSSLIFFIMVVCLFPLSVGADKVLLNKAAPGIIWVAALLAILISMGQLFRHDAEEGYLDVLLLSPHSMTLLVGCKIISYWLTHCLPLILISPLLGLFLDLTHKQWGWLMVSLLLGTPVLCLLGAMGAALTVGMRGNGLLLPILIMPLYIPTLIFGTGLVLRLDDLATLHVCVAMLASLSLISVTFAPWLTAWVLRMGVNQ